MDPQLPARTARRLSETYKIRFPSVIALPSIIVPEKGVVKDKIRCVG